MTDDTPSGPPSNRSRSRRERVMLDQKPLATSVEPNAEPSLEASVEQSAGAITPTDEISSAAESAEPIVVPESANTPDIPVDTPLHPDEQPVVDTQTNDTSVDETSVQPVPSAPQTKSGGVVTLLLAVLAGGVAGVAASMLLPPYLKSANDLETRLTAVEQSIASAPRGSDLDSAVKSIEEARGQSVALGLRLTALEERIAAANSGTGSEQLASSEAALGTSAAELAALREQVGRMDETLVGAGEELSTTIDKMRELEQSINTLDPARLQSEQAAIAQRLSSLETTVQDKLGQFDPARIAALADTQAGEIARLATRVTATEGAVTETERKALAAGASNRERIAVVARLAIIDRLRNALEHGQAYVNELDALTKLGVSGAQISALQVAANGIATPQSLAKGFAQAAASFEVEPVSPDASFVDKLAASASRIVRIRAIDGEADATDIAGQVENLLMRNDAAAALAAWQHLPQSARDATKAFADTLQARINAQNALASLSQSQVQALDASASAASVRGE